MEASSVFNTVIQVAQVFGCYVLVVILIFFHRLICRLNNEVFNAGDKMEVCKDRTILVTGATSGIGLAVTKYFHRLGYSVIACYFSSQEPGYFELQELKSSLRLYFVELNVRQQDSIARSYEEVKKLLKENQLQLHAIINNAGVGGMQRPHRDTRSSIVSTVETNLLGPMLMVRQYLPLLAKTSGSRVVNVSSGLAFLPFELVGVYGATKAGLGFYTASLGLDVKRYGDKTVTIHPGNLINNTSIVLSAEARNVGIWEELTSEERELYGEEYREHQATVEKGVKAIKAAQAGKARSLGWRKRFGMWLQDLLSGSVPAKSSLEDTEVMNNFDNAIRLVNPPQEMHAGNSFYTNFMGTLLEQLSHFNQLQLARATKIV